MYELEDTPLDGVLLIVPRIQTDVRGNFVKLFHEGAFATKGLITRFPETYVSTSRRGVVRGMHFQLPPHDHDKLVYCLDGDVLDVVVDLRAASPTFGRHAAFHLDGANARGVYIPKGCAHGFLAQSEMATMLYMVGTVYAPAADAGIRWDSFGFDWPVRTPIVSARDAAFVTLADFASPF